MTEPFDFPRELRADAVMLAKSHPYTADMLNRAADEIERLQAVKRRSLAIADERAIEAVKARAEIERLQNLIKGRVGPDAPPKNENEVRYLCAALDEENGRLRAALTGCADIADEVKLRAEMAARDLSYGELYGEQCKIDTAGEIGTRIRAMVTNGDRGK